MKSQSVFNCVMIIDDSDIDTWMAELLIRKAGLSKQILIDGRLTH